jgi:hypothetical protein
MNPIQSKIEQTAKEYLSYKAIVDREAEAAKKLSTKEELAKHTLSMEQEEVYNYMFDNFVSVELLTADMLQVKSKLYSQIELAKDIVDIPKEIIDLVEDHRPSYVYAIIGDEKKVVDEKRYEQYRKDYVFGAGLMEKLAEK